jgi:uncharacterized membrane protein
MLMITAFSVALALLYDRQELAIIALVGGFAAPFMVSEHSGNYQSLFIYLIILNTGLLVLAYYKSWRLLNLLAFIFTIILFAGWVVSLPYETPAVAYNKGFIFATIFYVLFFSINIAHNIRENKKFIASDFGILLANTALYASAGMYFLYQLHATQYQGIFCAILAVINLALSYALFKNRKVDANILYLLIGITLTFISLTAPVQLHGNFITIFWASEAVLLYWLYKKSDLPIVRWSSFIILGAALVSLLMDWALIYANTYSQLPVVFNKACLTGLYTVGAYFFYYFLAKQQEHPVLVNSIQLVAWLLITITGVLEINFQFSKAYPDAAINILYIYLWVVLVVLTYDFINTRTRFFSNDNKIGLILHGVIIFYFLMLIPRVFAVQANLLVAGKNTGHFLAHWLGAILTGLLLYKTIQAVRLNKTSFPFPFAVIVWISCAIVVIFLSAEMHLLINRLFFKMPDNLATIQRIFIKTGLPILWGLCSFGFMWLGMKFKNKTLRIVSLSLFSITLFKLFTYDIRNIPVAGKIAAFFFLGVLLLVVSFMYQRLKKIIIDDEQKTPV